MSDFRVAREDITVDPDGRDTFPPVTRTLFRNEDSLRRPTGWDLKDGGTTEHGNASTYHATAGRLDTVTGSGSTFAYSYTPDSANLVATITGLNLTGGVFTVTNTWLGDGVFGTSNSPGRLDQLPNRHVLFEAHDQLRQK